MALVLAIFTLRRSNVARILLVVSAVLAALVSLLGVLAIVPLVVTLVCIATVVLLFTGGANQWFSGDVVAVPYTPDYVTYQPPAATPPASQNYPGRD